MSPAKPQADVSGRLVALLVFLVGVGMLVFVFVTALHLFRAPVPGLEPLGKAGAALPAANIGAALAAFVRELLLLLVMTLAGSLLASRGAHLYFGTLYPPAEAPAEAPSGKNGRGKAPAPTETATPERL
jgi:hypothetical protein